MGYRVSFTCLNCCRKQKDFSTLNACSKKYTVKWIICNWWTAWRAPCKKTVADTVNDLLSDDPKDKKNVIYFETVLKSDQKPRILISFYL